MCLVTGMCWELSFLFPSGSGRIRQAVSTVKSLVPEPHSLNFRSCLCNSLGMALGPLLNLSLSLLIYKTGRSVVLSTSVLRVTHIQKVVNRRMLQACQVFSLPHSLVTRTPSIFCCFQ